MLHSAEKLKDGFDIFEAFCFSRIKTNHVDMNTTVLGACGDGEALSASLIRTFPQAIMSIAKSTLRSVKNYTKGYSEMQIKVREATSNDAWGPEGQLMAQIAQATHDSAYFNEIMEMIDRRLNDSGKNWRHVYKSLVLLDYCLHAGSEQVVRYARDNLYVVKTLREFQYIDDEGTDRGVNVRAKAKAITSLLADEERLRSERSNRSTWTTRLDGDEDAGSRPSPPASAGRRTASRNASRRGNEDNDLQRAIEESKRTAEEEERRRQQRKTYSGTGSMPSRTHEASPPRARGDSDDDLQRALELSKREAEERERKMARENEMSLLGGVGGEDVFGLGGSGQMVPSSNNPFAAQVQAQRVQQNPLLIQQQQQPTAAAADPFGLMALGTVTSALGSAGMIQPVQNQLPAPQQPLLLDMAPFDSGNAFAGNAGQMVLASSAPNASNNPFGMTLMPTGMAPGGYSSTGTDAFGAGMGMAGGGGLQPFGSGMASTFGPSMPSLTHGSTALSSPAISSMQSGPLSVASNDLLFNSMGQNPSMTTQADIFGSSSGGLSRPPLPASFTQPQPPVNTNAMFAPPRTNPVTTNDLLIDLGGDPVSSAQFPTEPNRNPFSTYTSSANDWKRNW